MSQPPQNRPRVAILGAFPPQSQGVMDYCAELARKLSTRCDVTALGFSAMYPAFLYPGGKTPIDPTKVKLEGASLTVRHRLAYYNPFGWLWAGLTTEADVLHAQWWSLPLWPVYFTIMLLMRLRGKRVVITVHNVLPHEKTLLFVSASRALCKVAHKVLVHSDRNLEQARQHYRLPPDRVEKVPMGPYETTVKVLPKAASHDELGLAAGARVILLYGALRPYKGIDVLLRAFAKVAAEVDDARLVIAGKRWMDWMPYERIIRNNRLEERVLLFTDYIPESRTPFFFSAADIVVLPYTHFDAQSAVASQAFPYLKPMLVSDVGGLPEWVGGDPHWVVPPGDADALAHRLIEFFGNQEDREAEFRRLHERVAEDFSWERIVDAYLKIYKE